MFFVYNLLVVVLAPLWAPWMWLRTRARKAQPNWEERFGNYALTPRKDGLRVWFHAVSVGEVVAAVPILEELRNELPTHEIVLSVTTSSGHQAARDKASHLFDHLVYFPIDVARFQLAAMQRVQPSVVAIMETELWMNFLWAAKTFDAKTLLVNGRISDRSFRRSLKVRFFYRALLARMDRCLMQTEKDAIRITALGGKSVEVLGNCKFDQALAGARADPGLWREELGIDAKKPTVVVGSIRTEELNLLAEAVKLCEGPQWVIAPRHLEKADSLIAALGSAPARRSAGEKMNASGILILDSYGELDQVYSIADLVIVGGGFADLGGQNIVQPLAHGKPVLHGSHMHNFREAAAAAVEAGASTICSTAAELAAKVKQLLADPRRREEMGEAARMLVRANAGASKRYAQAIAEAGRAFKS